MTDILKISIHYGTVEIVQAYKADGDAVLLGGYSIKRDRDGNEISRTEPTHHIRMYWA